MRNYPKLTDLEVEGKSVLVKCDFNVPIADGAISDEFRLDVALPTLKYLLERNAKIILVSHLGRPDGERNSKYSLALVRDALQVKLNKQVEFIDNFRLDEQRNAIKSASAGSVILLENIRFYPEEQSEDEATRIEFAKELLQLADIYVNEAFGDYRQHASAYDIAKIAPHKALGLRFGLELEVIGKMLENPERPLVTVIGGAKLSSKLDLLQRLCEVSDHVLVGGAMAYTLLKAQGHDIGNSLVELDKLDIATKLLADFSGKIHLPEDHVAASEFTIDANPQPVSGVDVPDGLIAMDIGPATIAAYNAILDQAKSIIWNGPLGVSEWDNFAEGTRQVGTKVADQQAYTLVGGGDTIAAVYSFDLEYGINHISAGGGAMMDLIGSGTLDTIEAICS